MIQQIKTDFPFFFFASQSIPPQTKQLKCSPKIQEIYFFPPLQPVQGSTRRRRKRDRQAACRRVGDGVVVVVGGWGNV